MVRALGGSRVDASALLAPNADPHDFEVRPHDVEDLAGADLIVRSGGVDRVAGADAQVLTLGEHVRLEGDDPHWWQDPRNAQLAVPALRDALIAADPAGAAGYRRAAGAYAERLRRLDRAIAACIDKVPAAARTLVTTHDSLGYFARRYGLRVVGAVIPSRSTVAAPSVGEVTALVDTIRREHVRAVFAESAVRSDVEQAIADDAGARVGRPLWADSLGPAGTASSSISSSARWM